MPGPDEGDGIMEEPEINGGSQGGYTPGGMSPFFGVPIATEGSSEEPDSSEANVQETETSGEVQAN